MLARRGIEVTAVDGNPRALERAKVGAAILGYQAAFVNAEILQYVSGLKRRYDLVRAAGVLYHQVNPPALVEAVARATDRLYLWSRYFDEALLADKPDIARHFNGATTTLEAAGFRCVGHQYKYRMERNARFLGAAEETVHWIRREDIVRTLCHFGLSTIVVTEEEPDNPLGPAFGCLASRPR